MTPTGRRSRFSHVPAYSSDQAITHAVCELCTGQSAAEPVPGVYQTVLHIICVHADESKNSHAMERISKHALLSAPSDITPLAYTGNAAAGCHLSLHLQQNRLQLSSRGLLCRDLQKGAQRLPSLAQEGRCQAHRKSPVALLPGWRLSCIAKSCHLRVQHITACSTPPELHLRFFKGWDGPQSWQLQIQ